MANMGDRVVDRISGFGGIVTGRAEYLYGCVQVLIAPETTHEGKVQDSVWLDEDRTVVVYVHAVERPGSALTRAGGPTSQSPKGRR